LTSCLWGILLFFLAEIARSFDHGCWVLDAAGTTRLPHPDFDLIRDQGDRARLQDEDCPKPLTIHPPSQITRVEPAFVDFGIVINKCYLMPTRAWGPPPFNVRPCKPGPATPSEPRKGLDSASSNYMYRKEVR